MKRLSPKTEGFVVTSHSKLDPYRVELLYVRVKNSSHNGLSSWFTTKYETVVVSVVS